MLASHRDAIAAIVERLQPEAWAQAFTGLLLRVERHKSEVVDYAKRLIHAHAYRTAPFQLERLDLSRETLVPNEDYDAPPGASDGCAFIPRRSQWNGVLPIEDPVAFRGAMQWSDDSQLIKDLRDALRAYRRDAESVVHRRDGTIVCAVHPYADCTLVPTILFGLRDLLADPISFALVDWVDLPRALHERRLDIAYSSSDLLDRWPEAYEMRLTRTEPSRTPALIRASPGE